MNQQPVQRVAGKHVAERRVAPSAVESDFLILLDDIFGFRLFLPPFALVRVLLAARLQTRAGNLLLQQLGPLDRCVVLGRRVLQAGDAIDDL